MLQRSGQRHARRPAQSGRATGHARAVRRFVQQHRRRRLTRKQNNIGRNRCIAERGVYNCVRRVCEPGNLRHLLRLHIAEIKHHFQCLLSFFLALRRKRDVVRICAHGAVEMILGHGVEDRPVRRQPPEAATRRLRPVKFLHAVRRRVQKCHRHRASREFDRCTDFLLKFLPVYSAHRNAPLHGSA